MSGDQSEWGVDLPAPKWREPQPGDGPEYHADHAYWKANQSVASPANGEYREPLDEARKHGVDARNQERLARAQQRERDSLASWLFVRFGPREPSPEGDVTWGWARLTPETRAFWEHEADAVRRAVERGGYKDPTRGGL